MALIKVSQMDNDWGYRVSHGEPLSTLVKISSRGLVGKDRQDLIERAGGLFAEAIDKLQLKEGQVPVHSIAMGAGEYYGCNRNGDFFSESWCRSNHPTFTKYARHYRHHQNRDPSKSYGIIKLSAYNEDMKRIELLELLNGNEKIAEEHGGLVADKELEKLAKGEDIPGSMACFLDPSYPVLTRDRGYVPIAEVTTFDYVWTHRGRWRKVKGINRRRYTGGTVTVHLNGLPVPLRLTADHPMWAKLFRGSQQTEAVKAKARRFFANPAAFEQEPAGWVCAEHLQRGSRLFYRPVTRYEGYGAIACTKLAAIMGYYTAAGSGAPTTVSFACNVDDSLPRRLPALIGELWPDVTVQIKPHPTSPIGLSLDVYSAHLARFLEQYMGRRCRGKSIPPEIFNAEDDVKWSFLGAWGDGNGWADAKGFHWSSACLELLLQGRDLLASMGVPSSLYRIDHSSCATSGHANSGVEYTLNLAALDAWRLVPYSEKAAGRFDSEPKERDKPACMQACSDGTYAYRVKKVEEGHIEDIETYNIEVEEDESYSAAGLISHNCLVAHDVCMACGNKARNRQEYCDERMCKRGGVKRHLGKVCDDGFVMAVDNPDPTWFDYSTVFRPADRIAYGSRASYLEKAASSGELSGAELAEVWGVGPTPAVIEKLAGWYDRPDLQDQLKLACALARLEPLAERISTPKDAGFTGAVREKFPVTLLGTPGSLKLAASLNWLADNKMILHIEDFAALVGQPALGKTAAAYLPGIYNRLWRSGELAEKIADFALAPASRVSTPVPCVVKYAEEACSLDPHAVQRRAMRAALRQISRPVKRKAKDLPEAGTAEEKLAEQYALYKLAALARMAERARSTEDLALTCENAILQNYVQ